MKKFILFLLLSIGIAQATTSPLLWIQSNQITGFNESINTASKQNTIPVYFPEFIPYSKTWPSYYFRYAQDTDQAQGYNISITTPHCNGEKACTLLSFRAMLGNNLQAYNTLQGPEIILSVVLQNGIEAQYVPGHTDADYWTPSLTWYQNGVTYILDWQGLENKQKTYEALITMASDLISLPLKNQENS